MKVRYVMTRKTVTLRANDSLDCAIQRLSKNKISGCPVVDGKNRIIGIVAQSDIVRLVDVYGKINSGKDFISFIAGVVKGKNLDMRKLKNIRVKDFINKNVITIGYDDDIYGAARLMNKHDIDRLPVVSKKKLVGIVTRSDIVRLLERME